MKLAVFSLLCLLGITLAVTVDRQAASDTEPKAMRAAAMAFLGSLDEKLREQATFVFDDGERKAWSNLPHTMFKRLGVRFGELSKKQKVLAHHLIPSPLSSSGYLKVSGIMHVDEILQSFAEARGRTGDPMFGQDYYWIGIFGYPGTDAVWGWQLDGHHLALNFTVVGDQITVTPTFLGADPAEVRDGIYAGFRPLGAEDEQGLRLFATLDEAQRKLAVIADTAPADVIAGPKRAHLLAKVEGLPASKMKPDQRELMMRLIGEWAHNLDIPLALDQLARIRKAGIDAIHFAWAGTEKGKPYYYRIHGPTVLIEFDNSFAPGRRAGPVNHIHTVWRDLEHDYGGDLLRQHYEEHHR